LLQTQRAYCRLNADRAAGIVEEIRSAVRGWDRRARALGASSAELSLLGAVIDPER